MLSIVILVVLKYIENTDYISYKMPYMEMLISLSASKNGKI